MKKHTSIVALLAIMLFGCLNFVVAQPDFDDNVNDIPVDGGITLLLAAGAALGGKKLYDASKKQSK